LLILAKLLEMLTIIRSTERFHIYLAGIEFKVVTDCTALMGAINKANINPARGSLDLEASELYIQN